MTPRLLVSALCLLPALLAELSARASLIPTAIPGVTAKAFQQGDSPDPNGDGGVNNVVNGDGLTVGNVADAATWTHDVQWQTGWQGNATFVVDSAGAGSANTPGAWFIADLGASFLDLDKMYVWNVREGSVQDRGTKTVDLFYADLPTVNPTTGSAYDFASGGWTSFLAGHDIPQNFTVGPDDAHDVIDLSAIPSARYIGIRILTNYNSNFRVGFSEIQFTTAVPEPATGALLALGVVALTLRRRSRA